MIVALRSILILLAMCLSFSASIAEEERGETTIVAKWVDANIREVIAQVAEITGKKIEIHSEVRGQFWLESDGALTLDEFYDMFVSALHMYGYEAVQGIDAIHIVPLGERPEGE